MWASLSICWYGLMWAPLSICWDRRLITVSVKGTVTPASTNAFLHGHLVRLGLFLRNTRQHPPSSLNIPPSIVSLLPSFLSFHCLSPSTASLLPSALVSLLPSSYWSCLLFTLSLTCRYAHGILTYLVLLITLRVERLLCTNSHGSINMAGGRWILMPLLILRLRYQKDLTLIHRRLLLIPWTLTQEKMKAFLVLVSSCTNVTYS